jgi:hypothetical protein
MPKAVIFDVDAALVGSAVLCDAGCIAVHRDLADLLDHLDQSLFAQEPAS